MLATIQIKNFALIEQLSLEFKQGMTVITGETGAGKSIVIDALGLALGERAESSMVRFGQEKAEITASFQLAADAPAIDWLEEHELDADGECILRRVVAREGRSKCFINGTPATLAMLSQLGDKLVDIHGQHAHQSLLKPSIQLELLDQLVSDDALLQRVAELATRYQKIKKKLDTLQQSQTQRQERSELLAYQLDELSALKLSANSISELESEHARASHLQELTDAACGMMSELFDQDGDLLGQLQHWREELSRLQRKDTQLTAAFDLLASACNNLEEMRSELRHYQDSLELDPRQLEELNERLATLFDLSRKHHCELVELPAVERAIANELQQLTADNDNNEQLLIELDQIEDDYQQAALSLSKKRQKAALELAKQVSAQMQQLGMEGGQFAVDFSAPGQHINRHGLDQLEFQVTANPGQPLQALNKVASGGELSRISLAIQVITAQQRITPTLIFDEVDVGIGGQTADIVGRMLAKIAQHAQVLCVTHQPQVAAKGQQHLLAEKSRGNNNTETAMISLTGEQRVQEIARMVGGQSITASTIKHAQELIETP
ncbi:MAG: DNA repair protein RecN [Gammaproteobacteria bacterium]|nr:DNA repair protein RecN [Gammaproteobacteria bacterium]